MPLISSDPYLANFTPSDFDAEQFLQNIPEDYTEKKQWTLEEAIAFVSNKLQQLPEDLFPTKHFVDVTRGVEYEVNMNIPYFVIVHKEGWDRPVFHWAHPLTVEVYTYFCMETMREIPPAVEWQFEDNRDYPQTNVAAIDGAAFANWLSEKLGLIPCYEVTPDKTINQLHTGFAVQMPDNIVYETMIDGITDLSDEQLTKIAIHKENSEGFMQRVRAKITPWRNSSMLGVVGIDGTVYLDIPAHFGLVWGQVGNVYTIVAVREK